MRLAGRSRPAAATIISLSIQRQMLWPHYSHDRCPNPQSGLQRCHGIATIEYIERHAVNTEEGTLKSLGVDDCSLQTLIYGVV